MVETRFQIWAALQSHCHSALFIFLLQLVLNWI